MHYFPYFHWLRPDLFESFFYYWTMTSFENGCQNTFLENILITERDRVGCVLILAHGSMQSRSILTSAELLWITWNLAARSGFLKLRQRWLNSIDSGLIKITTHSSCFHHVRIHRTGGRWGNSLSCRWC